MTSFIHTQQSLSKAFCSKLISRFSNEFSEVASINISGREDWVDEDNELFEKVSNGISKYISKIEKLNKNYKPLYTSNVRDTGYLIQRFPVDKTDQPPIWLCDSNIAAVLNGKDFVTTSLTYFWFLNDVKQGGGIVFSDGTKIEPKAGRLVIFPDVWTLTYSFTPPKSEERFICIGNLVCGPVEKVSTEES